MPSILLSGTSTPMPGTLAAGVFGGGSNSSIGNGGLRGDLDLQILWQFDNLGLEATAAASTKAARRRIIRPNWSCFACRTCIAAEVIQARAEAQAADVRVTMAEKEVRVAIDSVDKNLAAFAQTRRVGNGVQMPVRPAEVVLAVQALAQAYVDYYGAVADVNRAQFHLYRALGKPAQCLVQTAAPPLHTAGQSARGDSGPVRGQTSTPAGPRRRFAISSFATCLGNVGKMSGAAFSSGSRCLWGRFPTGQRATAGRPLTQGVVVLWPVGNRPHDSLDQPFSRVCLRREPPGEPLGPKPLSGGSRLAVASV